MPFKIQIKGIPGSGKSYTCTQLPDIIKCFDTDDYITKAYDLLVKKGKKIENVNKLAQELLEKDMSKHDKVVVVGILFDIKDPTHKYFIKMSNDDLEKAYKRTVLREIVKYSNITTKEVLDHIKKLDNDEISKYLRYKHHINAMEPVEETYEIYKKSYKNASKYEKKNGLKLISQIDIIDEIKSFG
jgi:hypothetical protein